VKLLGNRHQHPVTHQMAERVVDILEPVEIDQRDHHRIAIGRAHCGRQLAVKAGAVEEPGQPVMLGRALQGRIAQMLLGAIVDDPGDAIGPPFDIDPLAHHPDAAALAIAAADAGFEGEGLAVRSGLLERFADHCLILGLVERHRLFDADRAPGFEPGDGIDLVRPVEPLRGEIDPPRSDIGGAFGLAENLRGLLERGIGEAQLAGADMERDALFGQFGEHRQAADLVAAKGVGFGRDGAQRAQQHAPLAADRHAEIGADERGAGDQRIVAKAQIGAGIGHQQRPLAGDAQSAEGDIARGLVKIDPGAPEEALPRVLDNRQQRDRAAQHGARQHGDAREQRPIRAHLKAQIADHIKAVGIMHARQMALTGSRIRNAGAMSGAIAPGRENPRRAPPHPRRPIRPAGARVWVGGIFMRDAIRSEKRYRPGRSPPVPSTEFCGGIRRTKKTRITASAVSTPINSHASLMA
jgi:hypothetical protein